MENLFYQIAIKTNNIGKLTLRRCIIPNIELTKRNKNSHDIDNDIVGEVSKEETKQRQITTWTKTK